MSEKFPQSLREDAKVADLDAVFDESEEETEKDYQRKTFYANNWIKSLKFTTDVNIKG